MRTNLKIGIVLIAVAIAVIGSGYTYAYFSDQQDATGNSFTAGRLTLQVGSSEVLATSISASNMVPSSTITNAGNLQVQNTGTITGSLSMFIDSVADAENTRYHPEEVAGDTTTGTTTGGELSQFLKIALWVDVNTNGVCDSGDKYIPSNGTVGTMASTGVNSHMLDSVSNYEGHGLITYGDIAATTSIGNLVISYQLPEDTNINRVQSDSVTYNMHFFMNQTGVS